MKLKRLLVVHALELAVVAATIFATPTIQNAYVLRKYRQHEQQPTAVEAAFRAETSIPLVATRQIDTEELKPLIDRIKEHNIDTTVVRRVVVVSDNYLDQPLASRAARTIAGEGYTPQAAFQAATGWRRKILGPNTLYLFQESIEEGTVAHELYHALTFRAEKNNPDFVDEWAAPTLRQDSFAYTGKPCVDDIVENLRRGMANELSCLSQREDVAYTLEAIEFAPELYGNLIRCYPNVSRPLTEKLLIAKQADVLPERVHEKMQSAYLSTEPCKEVLSAR